VSLPSERLSSTSWPAPAATDTLAPATRDERRLALFRETPLQVMQRVALGTAWALMPKRAGQLVPLTRVWVSDLVSGGSDLPDATALAGTNEIAGIVRDLEPATLIEAYRRGLFPQAISVR
jgi:leucyl/phenylalanyl-tRNA---protein transferase